MNTLKLIWNDQHVERCCFACLLLLVVILPSASLLHTDARQQSEAVIAIVGATVVDGSGREPAPATVLIRGDRIAAVSSNVTVPDGARVIRAEGQTLIPGLFDLHTHLPYATARGVTGDWPKNLKAYLYCGVTSVVDFGTYPETFEPMRRLVSSGAVESPRLHLAARMTTPGGHGAEGGRGDFFSLEVLTPREARAAVRRVLPYRPDVIKVFTDGWRYGAAADMTSMHEETLRAIVDEAHRNGMEVLTHTVTLDKAKVAARAGVDVIAHGIGDAEVDAELVELMRAKGTTYAPTLAVYEPRGRNILSPLLQAVLDPAVRDQIQPALAPPVSADESIASRPSVEPAVLPRPATSAPNNVAPEQEGARVRRWQRLQHNTAALKKAGIQVGAGTDAGVTGTHHGWATLRELELLVAGGLTPLEAITAATANSAKALKVDGERGTIAVGKLADLVLIDGAPHRSIGDITRISRVLLGGREVDRERLARDIASETPTPLAAAGVGERIDDFEDATAQNTADMLRSDLGTLWVNSTDPGQDHSRMIFGRTLREKGDHALSVMGRLSETERPFIRVSVPLSRGAVEAVDASAFRGVRFDVRGNGNYRLIVPTRAVRDSAYFQTSFDASGQWKTIKLDFASLKQPATKRLVPWSGADLQMITFEITRPSGQLGWLELDNVRFYK